MTTPAISLVIPTFNSESSLRHSLISIRDNAYSQTEIVIVDGASTDNTLQILEEFPSLTFDVTSESDTGIYNAINKGIKRANGDVICVLGSDDEVEENALHVVARRYKKGPPQIISGRTKFIKNGEIDSLRPDEMYGPGCLLSGIPFCHNAMYVTRSGYDSVGLYDESYSLCADANWVHRAFKAKVSCIQLEDVLVRFSLSGASSSNAERLMNETYRSVVENFPSLSPQEAESIFRAVRGWGSKERAQEIVMKNQQDQLLNESFNAAMLPDFKVAIGSAHASNIRPDGFPVGDLFNRFIAKFWGKT